MGSSGNSASLSGHPPPAYVCACAALQLTAEKIIELLESHKSYHGLYFYLGANIAFSENPEVRPRDLCPT